MSAAAAPWSVKGIDPKAREVAKDLARRSGMTLGEWLNTMIMDDVEEDDRVAPLPRRPHVAEIFERRGRSRRLDDAYDREPVRETAYRDSTYRDAPYRDGGYGASDETLQRVAASVEAIAARLEASERRSTLAIQGVDQAVGGLLRRLDGQDEQAKTTDRRIDEIAEELREGHRRLRKFEQETGPHTAEIFGKMETAVAAVSSRLYDIEERQRTGINELRQRMDTVDRADETGRLDSALTAMASRLYDIEERQRVGAETLRLRVEAVERAAKDLPGPGIGAEVLAKVSARLDEAQGRTTEALKDLERSFAGLDQRMRSAEARVEPEGAREAARFEKLAETLSRQVESNRADMMRRLDTAETEGRIERIERAMATIGDSARKAEQSAAEGIDAMGREVMRIARNLNGRIEAVEVADGTVPTDQIQAAVKAAVKGAVQSAVPSAVQTAVQTAVQDAVEAGVGALRIDLAADLGTSLATSLTEKIDRDMGRYAQAVDQRMTRSEDRHALALEQLGTEITRISDRLADRIAQSERKSAQALEDIGNRLSESTDRIGQRYDRASGELAERMRLSEERTAALLAQAEQALEQRAARHAPVDPRPEVAQPDWRAAAFGDDAFEGDDGWSTDPLAADVTPAPFPTSIADATPASSFEPMAEPSRVVSERSAPAPSLTSRDAATDTLDEAQDASELSPGQYSGRFQGLASGLVTPDFSSSSGDAPPPMDVAPAPSAPAPAPGSTAVFGASSFGGADVQDALEATAAPQFGTRADLPGRETPRPAPAADYDAGADDFEAETEFVDARAMRASMSAAAAAGRAASNRSAIDAARAAMSTPNDTPAPRSGGGFSLGLKRGGKSRLQERLDKQATKDGSTVRKALLASVTGMAVIAGVYATGRLTVGDEFTLPGLDGVGQALGLGGTEEPPTDATPLLASALTPTDASATVPPEAQTLFDRAVTQLDTGDRGGVETLTRAANLGLPVAQLKLADLYASGEAGVTRDPSEARVWARRAAESGDARGMHAFGMYLYDGVGGAQNRAAALDWLVKAADQGLVDSQYNVAKIYEAGDDGIAANPTEAFKWYLIAARSGDPDAQTAVNRLTPTTPAAGRRAARAAAESFQVEPLA